ncbi:PEP-CTERM sorting domain-containing protein [Coleofasciculus sp. E2-BRE-01]|uniref:PEP-CTERM sorting domain-containing protein n=1 Tax=Coleofasciculus sp. E2-BRE-01 TaxID=3069524 RepID=UPI0032F9A29E
MGFIGKTASVFGVVGLSASIATLGVVQSASAVTVGAGFDFFKTGDGAKFEFDGFGEIEFEGVPVGTFVLPDSSETINVGNADTIVQRKQDVTLDNVGDSGMTDIEVRVLSLKSKQSVTIGEEEFDIFTEVTPDDSPDGKMTITLDSLNGNVAKGTFNSEFTFNFTALFVPVGGTKEDAICPELLNSCNFPQSLGADNAMWTSQAPSAAIQPDKGFFTVGVVPHRGIHPTSNAIAPEPLTILGSATALGFGAFFKKQSSRKRNKKDVS